MMMEEEEEEEEESSWKGWGGRGRRERVAHQLACAECGGYVVNRKR